MTTTNAAEPTTNNLAPKTILVVDDDEDFLLQTKLLLEAAGYRVVTAEGLKAADLMLAEQKPDVVVADLMMEFMDAGFVLCHHVKKKDPRTPVILITAVTSETGIEFDASTAEERGWIKADAVLSKPVRKEQLLGEIHRLLS